MVSLEWRKSNYKGFSCAGVGWLPARFEKHKTKGRVS